MPGPSTPKLPRESPEHHKERTALTSCTNSAFGVVGASTLIATTPSRHVPRYTSEKKPMPIFSSRSTSYRVIVQLGRGASRPPPQRVDAGIKELPVERVPPRARQASPRS